MVPPCFGDTFLEYFGVVCEEGGAIPKFQFVALQPCSHVVSRYCLCIPMIHDIVDLFIPLVAYTVGLSRPRSSSGPKMIALGKLDGIPATFSATFIARASTVMHSFSKRVEANS
eukprot:10329560-Ditylum_brightwellii.AAC.1